MGGGDSATAERILTFTHTEARINVMGGEKNDRQAASKQLDQRGEDPCYCQRSQAAGAL